MRSKNQDTSGRKKHALIRNRHDIAVGGCRRTVPTNNDGSDLLNSCSPPRPPCCEQILLDAHEPEVANAIFFGNGNGLEAEQGQR